MNKQENTVSFSVKPNETPKNPFYSGHKEEEIPKIVIPKFLRLTHAQVKAMSNKELLKVLSGETYEEYEAISPSLQSLVNVELITRANKSHWSVIPSFLLLIVSVALALYVSELIPQVKPLYLQAGKSIEKDGNLKLPQEKVKEQQKLKL